MKNYYDELEKVLLATSKEQKTELFYPFYELFQSGNLNFEAKQSPMVQTKPSYAGFCRIVRAEETQPRIKLDTDEGKARFVHAILHIEYSAVDLALDHAYRFRNLPREYCADWLEVAEDEIRHYQMLEEVLSSLGHKYGDFEVHQTLFDAQMATMTLRQRMAVIPRYLEANGLDANVKMMEKLQGVGDAKAKQIVKALRVILEEEISHVSKGDRWFLYACGLDGVERSIYFDDVTAIMPNAWRKRGFVNEKARLLAGFDTAEINRIKNGEI